MNTPNVTFNDFVINDLPGVEVEYYDANQAPEMEILQYKVARADRSIITNKSAVQKRIPVYLRVCNGNRAGTELTIALLKLTLLEVQGVLDLEQVGSRVTYTATCTEISIEFEGKIAYVTLTFTASDPFGKLAGENIIAFPNITTASTTFPLTSTSTVTIRPAITILFDSVTDGTGESVSIRNSATNQGITVTNDFSTGDTLYIDSEAMVVTLNGAPVDFTGVFPFWTPDLTTFLANNMNVDYIDTFTARDVSGILNFETRV